MFKNLKDYQPPTIENSNEKMLYARNVLAKKVNILINNHDDQASYDEEDLRDEEEAVLMYLHQEKKDGELYKELSDIPCKELLFNRFGDIRGEIDIDLRGNGDEADQCLKELMFVGRDFEVDVFGKEHVMLNGTEEEFQVNVEKLRAQYMVLNHFGLLPKDKEERLTYMTRVFASSIINDYDMHEVDVPARLKMIAGSKGEKGKELMESISDEINIGFEQFMAALNKQFDKKREELKEQGVDDVFIERRIEVEEDALLNTMEKGLMNKPDLDGMTKALLEKYPGLTPLVKKIIE